MHSTVRAFHLLLIAFCSVIALMAAILASSLAVSLGDGFEQYLDSEDSHAFSQIAAQLHRDLEEMASAGISDPERLRAGLIARVNARRDASRAERNLMREEGRSTSEGALVAYAMYPRLIMLDPAGRQLFGPPMMRQPPPHLQKLAERIDFGSGPLVTVKLLPRPPIAPGANNAYINSRYRAIGLAALSVLLCGILAAWLTARYISSWLEQLRDCLSAIAARRFDTEVPLGITTEQREIGMAVTEMAATLREADTKRRRWFAEVGHEIRTPLTILRGELEALIDGIRIMDRSALKSLQEETLRLTHVTEDLRLLSLAELGEVSLSIGEDEAVARCFAVAARWRKPAEEAGHLLEVSAKDRQVPVHWDRHKIERVIDNLLTNALRYTSPPGTISLNLMADDNRVTITVEDSAPGVPTEHLEEIFEPLSRAMRNAMDPDGGSGLGLAIVQAVVEAHGGMVGASHSAMGGLRVVLSIPRRPGVKRSVAIAEDDTKIGKLMCDYIRDGGYEALWYRDGPDLLADIGSIAPSAIVLDIMLPRLDGFYLCEKLREETDVPILIVTARVTEADRLRGLDAGADDYVCKPFSMRELVARIDAIVRRAEGRVLANAAVRPFAIDQVSQRIAWAGNWLTLSRTEYRILATMMRSPDRVFSRDELLDVASDEFRDVSDRAIDSHIKNVRRKIEEAQSGANPIKAAYGLGYRFDP